jgi:hypothetical protein
MSRPITALRERKSSRDRCDAPVRGAARGLLGGTMKHPHRRQFLHLAAGAAVLPVTSRIARAQSVSGLRAPPGTAPTPDFSGVWGRFSFPAFVQPPSGPGPLITSHAAHNPSTTTVGPMQERTLPLSATTRNSSETSPIRFCGRRRQKRCKNMVKSSLAVIRRPIRRTNVGRAACHLYFGISACRCCSNRTK